MPDNKIIPFSKGEYSELDNLKAGDKVKFDGEAVIVDNTQDDSMGGDGSDSEGSGDMGLKITNINVSPEDEATRTLKDMTSNDQGGGPQGNPSGF